MSLELLLALPPELQNKIAENLSAIDLMQLRSTCRALRESASWKQLTFKKIQEESFITVGPAQLFWCCVGYLFACGYNLGGNLGLGDRVNRSILTKVDLPFSPSEGIAEIISKGDITFIITKTGRIFVAGSNLHALLGLKDHPEDALKFTEVKLPLEPQDRVKQIVTDSVTLFLSHQGRVFVCGRSVDGALGLGPELKSVATPTELFFDLSSDDQITYVTTSSMSTVCLSAQGRVYVFGSNARGQLGQADVEECFTPTELFIPLAKEDIIQSVMLESMHLFLRSHHGRVFACGHNQGGELGLGPVEFSRYPREVFLPSDDSQQDDPIEKIIGTNRHTFFQTKQKHIFACGKNVKFNLGCAPNTVMKGTDRRIKINTVPTLVTIPLLEPEYIQQIIASERYNFFLTHCKNRLFVAGHLGSDCSGKSPIPYEKPECTQTLGENQGVKQLCATDDSLFFLTNTMKLFVVGENQSGELGLPDKKIDTPKPVSLPMPILF